MAGLGGLEAVWARHWADQVDKGVGWVVVMVIGEQEVTVEEDGSFVVVVEGGGWGVVDGGWGWGWGWGGGTSGKNWARRGRGGGAQWGDDGSGLVAGW